jgi:nitrite reductase/ring-hydroxylating ferredoxin subunit
MFPKPGSYITLEHPAGYSIFLVRGKDGIIRAFHNVCRHRAYPVISTKTYGCTPVLGCRYHGWSYNLKGKLVKAPKFEDIKGFDKESNSLFEIGVEVSEHGVVSVNTSGRPPMRQPVVLGDPARYVVETWSQEGSFNWKIAGMFNCVQIVSTEILSIIRSIECVRLSPLCCSNSSRVCGKMARDSVLTTSSQQTEHALRYFLLTRVQVDPSHIGVAEDSCQMCGNMLSMLAE